MYSCTEPISFCFSAQCSDGWLCPITISVTFSFFLDQSCETKLLWSKTSTTTNQKKECLLFRLFFSQVFCHGDLLGWNMKIVNSSWVFTLIFCNSSLTYFLNYWVLLSCIILVPWESSGVNGSDPGTAAWTVGEPQGVVGFLIGTWKTLKRMVLWLKDFSSPGLP